jgi:acyl-CoA dehydrogenase
MSLLGDPTLAQAVERLFPALVDRAQHDRVAAGAWPEAAWRQVVAAGLPLALATEAAGGSGASWADCWPILHGVGRWQLPLPLAETLVGAQLLSMAAHQVADGMDGVDVAKVAAGAVALVDAGCGATIRLERQGGAARLYGTAPRVPWARHCGHVLVSLPASAVTDARPGPAAAPDDRAGLLALVALGADRSGGLGGIESGGGGGSGSATVANGQDAAGMPLDAIRFDAAPVILLFPNPLPGLSLPIRTLEAIARSAAIAGALDAALEMSLRHATDRVQFGRPIGGFQAIQHQLALLAGEVAAARTAAMVAVRDAPGSTTGDGLTTPFDAAVAKVRSGEAAGRAAAIAHQVHGAIGFTHEHGLHHVTGRLWAWREQAGSDAWWAGRLGAAAIDARAAGFWPSLTARHMAPTPGDTMPSHPERHP